MNILVASFCTERLVYNKKLAFVEFMSYPKTFCLVSLGLASSAAGYACLVSSLCKLNLQGGVGAQLAGKTFGALNPC